MRLIEEIKDWADQLADELVDFLSTLHVIRAACGGRWYLYSIPSKTSGQPDVVFWTRTWDAQYSCHILKSEDHR